MTKTDLPTMGLLQWLRVWNRAHRYYRKSEPAECRFACASIVPGQNVLDIGAHKGAFTYWLSRRVGPDGAVYAFEPQPALVDYLERFSRMSWHRNVKVCGVALSDSSRLGRLEVPATQWGHLLDGDADSDSPVLEVPVETLDEYLDSIQAARPISFIKCDVELHELPVFRGARGLLERDRPTLLFESTPMTEVPTERNETFQFLFNLGYEGYFFCRDELVRLDDYRPEQHQLTNVYIQNFVFIHPAEATLVRMTAPYELKRHESKPVRQSHLQSKAG